MKKKICICGGGANGILAALFFEKKNYDVTLIERSSSIGGILKSNKSGNYYLDQGYWMPNYTGIKEMDDFFDKTFTKKKFNKFIRIFFKFIMNLFKNIKNRFLGNFNIIIL